MRQTGLVGEDILDTPINIIGAGGIGSFTTLALAKCGFTNLVVWDNDKIEEHNISNQFYPVKAVGEYKVEALSKMIMDFEGEDILAVTDRWSRKVGVGLDGVVISAVDNMKTREELYTYTVNSRSVIALVDGRMGANQLEVYSMSNRDREDKRLFKKTLCKDSETANVPCTERAVMYNVLNIASWIVNQVRLILSDKDYKRALIMDLENMVLVIPEEKKE